MSLTSDLYKAARLSASFRAIKRGPRATVRRVKNITVGRVLARAGFWRMLWR